MFPAVLAQALDSSNPTIFLGLLIGGLLTVFTLVNQVDAMISRRKRTPPIESEFVTKLEFREFVQTINSELKINRIAVEKLTSSINRDFNTLYRALGKVEGVTLEERRDDNE